MLLGVLLHVNVGAWCCAAGRALTPKQADPTWQRMIDGIAKSCLLINTTIRCAP